MSCHAGTCRAAYYDALNDWAARVLDERDATIELVRADLQWFCDRVDAGEVRSTRTYNRFRDTLAATSDSDTGEQADG